MSETQLRAEQNDHPGYVDPHEEDGHRGEARVDRAVARDADLELDVEQQRALPQHSRDESPECCRRELSSRVRHRVVEEREAPPQREERCDLDADVDDDAHPGALTQEARKTAPLRRCRDRCRCEDEDRRHDHHRHVVRDLAHQRTRTSSIPDVVEGLLDRAEQLQPGPQECQESEDAERAEVRAVDEGEDLVDRHAHREAALGTRDAIPRFRQQPERPIEERRDDVVLECRVEPESVGDRERERQEGHERKHRDVRQCRCTQQALIAQGSPTGQPPDAQEAPAHAAQAGGREVRRSPRLEGDGFTEREQALPQPWGVVVVERVRQASCGHAEKLAPRRLGAKQARERRRPPATARGRHDGFRPRGPGPIRAVLTRSRYLVPRLPSA